QNLNHWFNTSSSIWVQQLPDTLRTAKLRSPTIRQYSRPQYDATVIRNFKIREGHEMQFKVSAFNLTNTPIFGAPNTSPASSLFGVVPVTQINLRHRNHSEQRGGRRGVGRAKNRRVRQVESGNLELHLVAFPDFEIPDHGGVILRPRILANRGAAELRRSQRVRKLLHPDT